MMHYIHKSNAFLKVLLLLIFTLLVACDDVQDDVQMVQRATDYIAQKKISEASIELKNALKKNPENGEARFLLAEISRQIGDVGSAEKEFKRAVQLGWRENEALVGQMQSMLDSQSYKKVLGEIDAKIEESVDIKTKASLISQKALAEAALGYKGLAKNNIALAMELGGDGYRVLVNAIKLNIMYGEVHSAEKLLALAIEKFPDSAELLTFNALIKVQVHKDSEAAGDLFRKVMDLEPERPVTIFSRKARIGLAKIEMQNSNYDAVEQLFAPILLQYSNDLEVNYLSGLLAYRQSQFELAEERLYVVLKAQPTHLQTQLLFGTVTYAQKKYEQAAYYLAKYVREVPDNLGARKLLGRTYMALGQHEKASASLKSELQNNDSDAELAALVGLNEIQGGSIDAGILQLQKAIELSPNNKALQHELAKAYVTSGNEGKAIQKLETLYADDNENAETEFLLIIAYLRNQDHQKAIDIASEKLQRTPNDPIVLTLMGNIHAAAGNNKKAKNYFTSALKQDKEFAAAKLSLAETYEKEGHLDRAAELFREVSENNRSLATPLLALARIAEQKGEKSEMYKALEDARKQLPKNTKVRAILAGTYSREKKFNEAEAVVNELLEIVPGDSRYKLLLMRIYIGQKKFDKVVVPLKKLVDASPKSIYERSLLVGAYINLADLNNAQRHLSIILKQSPEYIPAIYLQASIDIEKGNYEKATKLAKKAATINPDLGESYNFIGEAALKSGKYQQAKENFQLAYDRKTSARLAIKISNSSMYLKQYSDAATPLLLWLETNPEDSLVRQYLGGVYMESGEAKKAAIEFEGVLKVQSDNIAAINNLAWIYSESGDSRALHMAQQAYELAPKNNRILDTYGWILVQNGKYAEGKKMLERALEGLSDNLDVQYHYATALSKLGEAEQARSILSEILASHLFFSERVSAEKLYQELR